VIKMQEKDLYIPAGHISKLDISKRNQSAKTVISQSSEKTLTYLPVTLR
jgi:hypothetical protein